VSGQKKFWVHRNGIVNAKYASDSIHGDLSCTGCHGGSDGTGDPALAHAGMKAIPGASTCQSCHSQTVALTGGSLHTTVAGYEAILGDRGVDLGAGSESRARYEKQCTRCHVATVSGTTTASACGQCHVSAPDTTGGGLVNGHVFDRTPDTVNNCTACHGSRVKDEYTGANNALYQRNRQYNPTYASADPFAGAALQADVHYAQGMGCIACHPSGEMHGAGVAAGIDRYGQSGRMQCESCHPALVGSNALHTANHLATMACQLCHAQPYKSCFSCHTQESASGAAYFTSNGTDPTRAARTPVATPWLGTTTYGLNALVTYGGGTYLSLKASNTNHDPTVAGTSWWRAVDAAYQLPGDALISFRAGLNPKYGVALGAKKYAVLRHVPVDGDVFTYDEEGTPMPGLIPGLSALPTWKYATPHNIVRSTAITSACDNCHGASYTRFWLTDPYADAFGWVPATPEFDFEGTGNAPYRVTAPIPMAP
jgi:hypothetical protein